MKISILMMMTISIFENYLFNNMNNNIKIIMQILLILENLKI